MHEGGTPRLRARLPRAARHRPATTTIERTLIVEVSGGRKDQAVRKRRRPRPPATQWCPAVNNHGGFGRWGFVEIDDMTHAGVERSTTRSTDCWPTR